MSDSMHLNINSFNNGSNVRLLSGNETESLSEGSGTQSRLGSSYTGVKNTSDSMEKGVNKRNPGWFTLKNVCIAAGATLGVTAAFGVGALTGFAAAGGLASACAYRGRNNNVSTTPPQSSPQSLPQNMPLECYLSLCKNPDSKIDVIPAPITTNGKLIFSGCNKPKPQEPHVGRHLLALNTGNNGLLFATCEGGSECWNPLDYNNTIPKPENVGLKITTDSEGVKYPDISTFSDVSSTVEDSLEPELFQDGACINPDTVVLRTKQYGAVVEAYLKFDLQDGDLNEILEDVKQRMREVNDCIADLRSRKYPNKKEMLASMKEAYNQLKKTYVKISEYFEPEDERCFK